MESIQLALCDWNEECRGALLIVTVMLACPLWRITRPPKATSCLCLLLLRVMGDPIQARKDREIHTSATLTLEEAKYSKLCIRAHGLCLRIARTSRNGCKMRTRPNFSPSFGLGGGGKVDRC